MDSVTFVSAPHRRTVISATNTVPVVKVKCALYKVPEEDAFVIAANKLKLIALNCKKPKELRIINRVDGPFADLGLSFSIHHLGFLSSDKLYAAGEKTLSLLNVELNNVGEIASFTSRDVDIADNVAAVAGSQKDGVVVLTSSGNLVVITADAAISNKIALKGPLGTSLLAVHRASGLAVVSSRSSGLDIVSLTSEKSVMSKLWLPHGEDLPTAVYVLQSAKYGEETSPTKYIITASQKNTELRFWTFNDATSTLSLLQQLTIASENADGSAASQIPGRLFVVSANEDFILLPAVDESGVVVVELDRQQFKASRATEWMSTSVGAFLCAAAFVRKTQDASGVNFELNIVGRSDERVAILQFDNSRLLGSTNLVPSSARAEAANAAPEAAPTKKESDVTRWFGNLAATALAAPVVSSAPTTVSSTISGRGGNTADAAFVQTQAVNALRSQASNFRDSMSALDQQVIAIQKQAGAVLKALQEQSLKDEAEQVGREFARRNKSRLTQQQQQQQQSAASSQQQSDAMLTLSKFTAAIPPAVNDAAKCTAKDTLAKAIPAAVEKALAQVDKQDNDLSLPKMNTTESMQLFTNAVDKSNQAFSKLLKNETAALESLTVKIVTSATERGKTVVQNSKNFVAALSAELSALRAEVQETKAVVASRGVSAASAAPRDPSEVIKQALSSAQAGRWADAVVAVTNTGDITIVMSFLQDKFVLANKQVLCDPASLPFGAFVTLLVSVANDIKSQPGNIPFRIGWLSELLVEWDDVLLAMKTDATNGKLLAGCQDQFDAVAQNIAGIDKKTEVDRSTRFNMQLITKMLRQLSDSQ